MKYSAIFTSVLVAVAVMLGACSRSGNDEILDTIPAEAGFIGRLNAKTLLESAGCRLEGNEWKAGKTVQALLDQSIRRTRRNTEDILKVLPAVDRQNIYIFSYGHNFFMTCLLTHPDAVAAGLEEKLGSPEKKDGFSVFENNIIMRDNQLWMAEDVEDVQKMLKAAANAPASGHKAMSKLSTSDETAASFVMNTGAILKDMPYAAYTPVGDVTFMMNSYPVYDIRLDGAKMHMEGTTYFENGDLMDTKEYIENINTSFCNYIPENTVAAVACGKLKGAFMEQIKKSLAPAAAPYLDAWNGTLSIAYALPADYRQLLRKEDQHIIFTVQYDKAKAMEILDMAAAQLPGVKRQGDKLTLDLGNGVCINATYTEDMLIFSTDPIAKHNAVREEMFKDNSGAMFVDLDRNNALVQGLGLPFGFKLDSRSKDEKGYADIVLDGSEQPFIESLLRLATDTALQRSIVAKASELEQ